ncbi:enoyl-CoA hydratase/isomerase family protein [Halobacterium litoreum]|uniref:Enoyl-CoA hydratase/isomerase family protein n=1 Tax=Halobacterium litoreum TaxID=2039234 RepID=A0ABD5NJ12_9EURY|nr:enoyl-CoA hydratase-related protein [Halobacterium litoreum]UHH12267.1 enoyl-CoA hydratase-related protein [Halobacterium litoreum]
MHTETTEGVLRVTFDRPEVMNAFTADLAADLAETIESAGPDTHDAILLTGEGAAFSAGGDVQSMAEREENVREAYERVERTFGRLAEAAMESRVPIVARVNGDAVGAGLAVVALSDFAYAVPDARFSCAFVRVGLVPDTGGSFLLPRLVGLREAKRLAFTADFVDAGEAADLGLVNDCVPEDELDETVEGLLDTLRARPTRTIGVIRQALHDNLGREWDDALDHENLLQSQAYDTDEHGEGVAAFLEGREPEF